MMRILKDITETQFLPVYKLFLLFGRVIWSKFILKNDQKRYVFLVIRLIEFFLFEMLILVRFNSDSA